MTLLLVAAAALIDSRNRLLLTRRPDSKSWPGKWELPGGKLEAFETPEQGLARELHEELGINVKETDMEPFSFVSHRYDDFALLMPVFTCRQWHGTPVGREEQALSWADADTLGTHDCLPSDTLIVGKLADHLRRS